MSKPFRMWVGGCSHVHTDIKHGRASLAESIMQSERGGGEGGPPYEWDIMLHLGDLKGGQDTPDDEDGREVLRQFAMAEQHPREHFYNLLGNHDGSGPDEPTQWWFKKWIDPIGENPDTSNVRNVHRPYPVEGTWERYSFQIGNILVLMMSDRNDGGPPSGRRSRGGYPAGTVTAETFQWWRRMVEANQDKIIISCHHHMLKNTTVASGPNEGIRGRYHGNFPDGAPEGASYLYFVGDQPDAQAFEKYLAAHPGAISLWLGGHTHSNPDDTYGGKSHVERKWGVTFVNCAALSRYHARRTTLPMSRLLTFVPGEDNVRIQCYLHTSQHAAQGWYEKAERMAALSRAFKSPEP